MRMAAMVAESHHEKWDGTGYPHGLSGTNIPIEGRIAAVCDVFDALSNPNAHRDAYPLEECFRMIHKQRGTHFDPEVVDVFFERQAEIQQVYYDFTG
jgi:putative two-component system response regulator